MTRFFHPGPRPKGRAAARLSGISGEVVLGNGNYWGGEVEPCDLCVTFREDQAEAYRAKGIEVEVYSMYDAPAEPEVPDVVIEPPEPMVHVGGGWYDVKGQRVRGRANALRILRG